MRRPTLHNADVARALKEMALFLEVDDVPFKPQAYEKAAATVTAMERPLADVYAQGGLEALEELPGIGHGIAQRIAQLLTTGKMKDLEALRKKLPVDILGLTRVEGVGAKKAHALYEALGVRTLSDLKRVAEQGKIRELPHFGAKSEERILEAVQFAEEAAGRRPLGEVLPLARRIEAALAKVKGVKHAVVAGSIRRHRDTIGDVDVLVASTEPDRVSRAFEQLPEVQAVLAHGPTKTMVRLANGMDADLRVLDPRSFGAALLYFTGSKAHNVKLRALAMKKGLKLNEYGLFEGERAVASRTEEDVYAALGLPFIPPELREDRGEVERALAGKLPEVLEPGDLRGDLQVHTDWTDGTASVEAMARAAQQLGREYVVITDHTRDLAMTDGLDEQRLLEQVEEIRRVDEKLGGIRVLAGAEVNIRADGTLDLSDEALAKLDVVGAAVHSHFDLPKAQMTKRLVRAVENPNVDVLMHPLGRQLGRRKAVDCDFDEVLKACVRTGTVVEIDAQPDRLDLPDTLVRQAVEAGALLAVDSDAHGVDELRFPEAFGVGVARRGWVPAKQVVNTLPVNALLEALKNHRGAKAKPKRRRRASA